MSLIVQVDSRCALCGVLSSQPVLLQADARGSPDLDLRPPESLRSTLEAWIQHCPSCGYCADDISSLHEGADGIIESSAYRGILRDTTLPLLARRFLCWSIIQNQRGSPAKAGWAALHAAWACDDIGYADAASECRQKALASFRAAQYQGSRFAHGKGVEETILADILRRSGRLDEAEALCCQAPDPTPGILLEQYLATIRDLNSHSMDEARLEKEGFHR